MTFLWFMLSIAIFLMAIGTVGFVILLIGKALSNVGIGSELDTSWNAYEFEKPDFTGGK